MTILKRSLFAPFAVMALALTPLAPANAEATKWNVSNAQSEIGFGGTHAGRAFTGKFKTWTARVRFDADNLAESRIVVVIETGSAITGDKVQESTLKNGEWFSTKAHKYATFSSNNITAKGGNKYAAKGTLEIKGKKVAMTLPFTLTTSGNSASATGTLKLDRTKLNMGMSSDPKAAWVSKIINLKIKIKASK